jgi:hypothetical protein
MKRAYTAALSADRCKADIRLKDGSEARCMKPRGEGFELCKQHQKMFEKKLIESRRGLRNK